MNVTLIGMAGAGKSFVGRHLAKKLQYEFLDIDDWISERYGKELEKVLDELGDEKFVEMEEKAIIEATQGKENHVFSPGGSSIYEPKAMEHLDRISSIIFLKVPLSVIEERIGNSPERLGRVVGLGNRTFSELYNERSALYQKYAHHTLDKEAMSTDEMLQAIVDILELDDSSAPDSM